MRAPGARLSPGELTLVAMALLLPVPLLAVSGLSAPLPGAIERVLGSVVALEADDERSGGAEASRSNRARQAERVSFGSGRSAEVTGSGTRTASSTARRGSAVSTETPGPTPVPGEPEGDGDGGAGSPGNPRPPGSPGPPTSDLDESSSAGPSIAPGVDTPESMLSGVPMDTGDVDVAADAVSDVVGKQGGLPTDVGPGVPGTGAPLP